MEDKVFIISNKTQENKIPSYTTNKNLFSINLVIVYKRLIGFFILVALKILLIQQPLK